MILERLILSKTPQQRFLKKAPQKNYLLSLVVCFSTSSIMGLACEDDVGEAVREGNRYFSLKRFGFWKKNEGIGLQAPQFSESTWRSTGLLPRKVDPLFRI